MIARMCLQDKIKNENTKKTKSIVTEAKSKRKRYPFVRKFSKDRPMKTGETSMEDKKKKRRGRQTLMEQQNGKMRNRNKLNEVTGLAKKKNMEEAQRINVNVLENNFKTLTLIDQ